MFHPGGPNPQKRGGAAGEHKPRGGRIQSQISKVFQNSRFFRRRRRLWRDKRFKIQILPCPSTHLRLLRIPSLVEGRTLRWINIAVIATGFNPELRFPLRSFHRRSSSSHLRTRLRWTGWRTGAMTSRQKRLDSGSRHSRVRNDG